MAILTAAVSWTLAHQASAQTPVKTSQPPTGITVSPAFQQIAVKETEAQKPLEFKITNNRAEAQTINISTADFNALSESGGLFFVGTNPTQLQKKYGLATWLSLPQTTVTIQPRQTATIKAVVLNQTSLAPGGHYGALMLSLALPDANPAKTNITVNPIASSLLFVTKLGGETYRLELSSLSFSRGPFNLPGSVSLRFYNKGNTHLTPRGTVEVIAPSGRLISKGIINENSGLILPESFRVYSVDMKKVSAANLPGRYKLEVKYRFDGFDGFRTYQKSFLLFSPLGLVIVAILLAVILGAGWAAFRKPKAVKRLFVKLNKKSNKRPN